MFTYKQLRKYNNQILLNMLETEKKGLVEYKNKKEFEHERMTLKMIEKIEKVLKERESELK